MTTRKTAPLYEVQDALIPDIDLPAVLAQLVPVASKIGDSAATFIDKTTKLEDKYNLSDNQKKAITASLNIAQQILKDADLIGRLLRNLDQAGISVSVGNDRRDDK